MMHFSTGGTIPNCQCWIPMCLAEISMVARHTRHPSFLGKSQYLFDMFCCFWLKTKLPDVPWFQVNRSYMFHMVICNFLSFTRCFTGSWSNSTGFFPRWGSLAQISDPDLRDFRGSPFQLAVSSPCQIECRIECHRSYLHVMVLSKTKQEMSE